MPKSGNIFKQSQSFNKKKKGRERSKKWRKTKMFFISASARQKLLIVRPLVSWFYCATKITKISMIAWSFFVVLKNNGVRWVGYRFDLLVFCCFLLVVGFSVNHEQRSKGKRGNNSPHKIETKKPPHRTYRIDCRNMFSSY